MRKVPLLAGVLALAACGGFIELGTKEDDAAGKTFSQPAAGRGAMYVYQGLSGTALNVTVNQRTLGTLGSFGSYLRTELRPGHYDLHAGDKSGSVASLPIDLRAGEVRYVRAALLASSSAYTLREEPASVAQPAILDGRRVRDLQFLEVSP